MQTCLVARVAARVLCFAARVLGEGSEYDSEFECDAESADAADFAASVACFPIVVISFRNWSMKYCPADIPRGTIMSKHSTVMVL